MTQIRRAVVGPEPINPGELLALVTRPDAGAVALFIGIVRDHDPQAVGPVASLDYTAHPMAGDRIAEIVTEVLASADPDGESTVAAVHRTGHLNVGDNAFVVAVSAPHRRLAFAVCEQVVEQVKAQLPIWKQQFEADGTYRWSNL